VEYEKEWEIQQEKNGSRGNEEGRGYRVGNKVN
jgi:hypothetical protein